MEKKVYTAPILEVLKAESRKMLAGSGTINTGISDKPATGGGRAKGNMFSSDEDDASSDASTVWGD